MKVLDIAELGQVIEYHWFEPFLNRQLQSHDTASSPRFLTRPTQRPGASGGGCNRICNKHFRGRGRGHNRRVNDGRVREITRAAGEAGGF